MHSLELFRITPAHAKVGGQMIALHRMTEIFEANNQYFSKGMYMTGPAEKIPMQEARAGRQDTKHAHATVVVAVAGFLVNAFWALANIFFGVALVAAENAIVGAAFFYGYILIRRRRNDSAGLLVASVFVVHMVFVAVTFGYDTGAHHFLILGTVVPFLVFPKKAGKIASIFAAISGLAYITSIVFRDKLAGIVVVGDEDAMAIVNAVFLLGILAATTAFFVSEMRKSDDAFEAEHERSEALLYSLLPNEVATRLKEEPGSTIAERLPRVAILFADLVGFTEKSAQMQPEEIVSFLDHIFTSFDALAEKHGVEKIKTIGDAYMAAAGIPTPCPYAEERIAELALDMIAATADLPGDVQLRIGLHAGPAVAGVIGQRKPFYDVWGDTVNMASRMESHGLASRIQVTQNIKDALEDGYRFDPRGEIAIKGFGATKAWWLAGRK